MSLDGESTGWDRARVRALARPGRDASPRCWLAVPLSTAPHVLCAGGCGDRFETLTEFEQHIREQEMAKAVEAEIEAPQRHRRAS